MIIQAVTQTHEHFKMPHATKLPEPAVDVFDSIVLPQREFVRTIPVVENSVVEKVCYGAAGSGIKGGIAHRATGDFGFKAVENRTHGRHLHATVLQQLRIDHTRLTYRYSRRDFRLTDVGGNVIQESLA